MFSKWARNALFGPLPGVETICTNVRIVGYLHDGQSVRTLSHTYLSEMRFHALGIPHTKTNKDFNACAYTQKVLKFGKMMTDLGHEVIHYGHEDSDLVCSEHVSVLEEQYYQISYGKYDFNSHMFRFDQNKDLAYLIFWENAAREIAKRKQPGDFLLPFWGWGVKPICDAHSDMIHVEPGIGYGSGTFAAYKVFESYAIYHAYCGLDGVERCNQKWYETVIPNYFDERDFTYSDKKEDYLLFLGRVFEGKGVHIACATAKAAGMKLVIAGQMNERKPFEIPEGVEYVGHVDIEQRRELLSKAKGLIIASQYVEPFGGVQIEALLSGTPTITPDWGAFTENNHNGITGFRCRTPGDYLWAVKNIDKINPSTCRQFGLGFTLNPIGKRYEKYFKDLLAFEKYQSKM